MQFAKRLSVIVVFGLWTGLVFAEAATPPAAPQTDIFIVEKQKVQETVQVSGTVISRNTTRFSAQIPGRIMIIAGKEGDSFRKGAELIRIDDTTWRARLDAAIAQRAAAMASIRNANEQLQRELHTPKTRSSSQAPGGMGMPAMMDQMFTSPMQNMMGMRDQGVERRTDLISRETQLAQAQTKYKQAEAQIKVMEGALRDARTIAPFDGVIEAVDVEQGDTVQPGQPLMTFSAVGARQLEVDVPVRLVAGLKQGMNLNARLDGAGQPYPAAISRIFPVADRTQHTVRVELDFAGNVPATVGQYVEVDVPVVSATIKEALQIPQSAVVSKGGLSLVFAVDDSGKTKLRVVRLGESSGDQVIVLSGLKVGDRIVRQPQPGMRAGSVVK